MPTLPRPPAAATSAAIPATPPAASAAPTPAPAPAPAAAKSFLAKIRKGEHGIGLDIGRTADQGCVVQRLKEMPAGVANPAAACDPPICSGDLIVGVNGVKMLGFNDIVKAIRGTDGDTVTLLLQRP